MIFKHGFLLYSSAQADHIREPAQSLTIPVKVKGTIRFNCNLNLPGQQEFMIFALLHGNSKVPECTKQQLSLVRCIHNC